MDIPVDSINKTDRHNIAQILWKVVLSIINKSNQHEAYMFNVYLALLEYIAVKCHPAELSKKLHRARCCIETMCRDSPIEHKFIVQS
jgi:hypothetical protein